MNQEAVKHKAYRLGVSHADQAMDLDRGIPVDIYEVFEHATGRDYDHTSHEDEQLVLDLARAYETGHARAAAELATAEALSLDTPARIDFHDLREESTTDRPAFAVAFYDWALRINGLEGRIDLRDGGEETDTITSWLHGIVHGHDRELHVAAFATPADAAPNLTVHDGDAGFTIVASLSHVSDADVHARLSNDLIDWALRRKAGKEGL